MKILITGTEGRVGGIIIPAINQQHEIVKYDLKLGNDMHDLEQLKKAMNGCQAVIHLAGIPEPNKGTPEDYEKENHQATLNIINLMIEQGIKKLIYPSSGSVYGFTNKPDFVKPLKFPIDEQQTLRPHEPYTINKIKTEKEIQEYCEKGLIKAVVFRLENPGLLYPSHPDHFFAESSKEKMRQAFLKALTYEGSFLIGNLASNQIRWDKTFGETAEDWVKYRYPQVPCHTKGNESLYSGKLIDEALKIGDVE